jgi:hypothetical protein
LNKTLYVVAVSVLLFVVTIPCFCGVVEASSQYSIEQAISDQAQLNTLAFSGLGFLTGDLCSDSFLPPGKVADFFGFQYLRDVTQAGMGHSTDFLTNAANNVLYILNDTQKAKMITLAKNQTDAVNQFAYMRYPLMVAFRRQLNGTMPTNTVLSKEQVMNYSKSLYQLDAQISIQRAKLFADIINFLNNTQRSFLDNMVQGGFASWPARSNQLNQANLTHDAQVLVMTYASEMFGWYAGNIEADTYFCPERHADYFGGFYIKDAPAIGNPGYTINETITGESGAAFIATLDATQKAKITTLVNTQRDALNKIVSDRRAIATELRKALNSTTIDEEKVNQLEADYGQCDGEIAYYYATAFCEVGNSLTTVQVNQLVQLRNLSAYPTEAGKIYLYSEKINQPAIQNTDFLFSAQTVTTVTPTANPNVSNQQTTTTTTATATPLGPTESPAVPELQALPLVVILFTFMLALPLFKKKLQGTMK